jgi:uncharacterized protein YkwD
MTLRNLSHALSAQIIVACAIALSTTSVAAAAPAASSFGLDAPRQLAALNSGINAAPAFFAGRTTSCGVVTPMLASKSGQAMAGNFRDANGNCHVWLNLRQSSLLTASEICKLGLHEMGHLNGLHHSSDPGDVMYSPFESTPTPRPCVAGIGAKARTTGHWSVTRTATTASAAKPRHAVRAHVANAATCPDAGLAPGTDDLPQISAAILCLVNAERTRAGMAELALNSQLSQASQPMADRMVAEQFFAHDTPDGDTLADRIGRTGYLPDSDKWVVGENLAWGSSALATPQAIVDGWMNSPGHRANILASDYTDIGLGIALGSPVPSNTGGATYVTDFGQRTATQPRRLTVSVSPHVTSTAKRALARGINFRGACSRACELVGHLFVHITPAQAAGLDAAGSVAGSLRLLRAGHGTFCVQLTGGARRALRRLKHTNLTLVTTVSGTSIMRMTRVTLR